MPRRIDLRSFVRAIARAWASQRQRTADWNIGASGLRPVVLLGVSALPFAGSLWIVWSFFSTFRSTDIDFRLAALVQLGCAILGTAAFAPLQIASARLLEGAPTTMDAIADALVLAARRPLRTALLGALQGTVVSAPMWTLAITRSWIGPDAGFLIAVSAMCAGGVIALGLLPAISAPCDSPVRPLRWLAVTPALAAVAALAVLVVVEPPALGAGALRSPPRSRDGTLETDVYSEVSWVRDGSRQPLRVASPVSLLLATGVRVHPSPLDQSEDYSDIDPDWLDWARIACDPHTDYCAYFGRRSTSGLVPSRLLARSGAFAWVALTGGALAALLIVRRLWLLRRANIAWPTGATTSKVRLRSATTLPLVHAIVTAPRDGIVLETAEGDLVARHDGPVWALGRATSLDPGAELWLVTPKPLPRVGPRTGAVGLPRGSWLAPAVEPAEAALAFSIARALAPSAVVLLVTSMLAVSWLLILL